MIGSILLGTLFAKLLDNIGKKKVVKRMTWDKKTDETISTLHPRVRDRFVNFINTLQKKYGIYFRLYDGKRSYEKQNDLYQKFLKGGAKAAPPGLSYHEYGLAGDGVEVKNGKALWNYPNFEIIKKVANENGISTGEKFGDKPHLEVKDFGSVTDLLNLRERGRMENGYLIL